MIELNINNFSCIKSASLALTSVNVIIGPQGSGKSVTTKLLYFFADIMSTFWQSAEMGESFDDFKRNLSSQFGAWFPASAWGSERFNISFSAGEFYVRVLRRASKGKLLDQVAISFSDWFGVQYGIALDVFRTSQAIEDPRDLLGNIQVDYVLERSFRAREAMSRKMALDLKEDYIARQTFIPAGRAFFTSIGKLVAGLEQISSLDPVTIRFARLFANLRDRQLRQFGKRLDEESKARRLSYMNRFFGGELRFANDAEYIATPDGRRVPFTSLSSGQQELLPMWALLDYFNDIDSRRPQLQPRVSGALGNSREFIYIEEPEAHLFPTAQSLFMEFLMGSIARGKSVRQLIITTHSPYIMAKLNVFLKAGQLARRRKKNTEINDIVPRECWLAPDKLAAFALRDGILVPLIDDDGLIDGRYLDEISEDISREFSALLEIESEIS